MAIQTRNGKAFEYAMLEAFQEKLKEFTPVTVITNRVLTTAKSYFESFGERDKSLYRRNAGDSVDFLMGLEPRLIHGTTADDILQLEIVADKEGQAGDVRDVLAIRALQKWEIGVSAKNNHRAVKHSRLSNDIDFGMKWLGLPCSESYFEEIKPIFNSLATLRRQSGGTKTWASLGDYHSSVYVPILDAFKKELLRLDNENKGVAARRLLEYLIGNKDFYKVIKGNKGAEIQAYNLHGTLNQPFQNIKPMIKVPRLKLPSRLVEVVYHDNSKTTLLVTLSEGWQVSFRIHNASSRIEPSLKFDINLVSSPHTLFVNHLPFDTV